MLVGLYCYDEFVEIPVSLCMLHFLLSVGFEVTLIRTDFLDRSHVARRTVFREKEKHGYAYSGCDPR